MGSRNDSKVFLGSFMATTVLLAAPAIVLAELFLASYNMYLIVGGVTLWNMVVYSLTASWYGWYAEQNSARRSFLSGSVLLSVLMSSALVLALGVLVVAVEFLLIQNINLSSSLLAEQGYSFLIAGGAFFLLPIMVAVIIRSVGDLLHSDEWDYLKKSDWKTRFSFFGHKYQQRKAAREQEDNYAKWFEWKSRNPGADDDDFDATPYDFKQEVLSAVTELSRFENDKLAMMDEPKKKNFEIRVYNLVYGRKNNQDDKQRKTLQSLCSDVRFALKKSSLKRDPKEAERLLKALKKVRALIFHSDKNLGNTNIVAKISADFFSGVGTIEKKIHVLTSGGGVQKKQTWSYFRHSSAGAASVPADKKDNDAQEEPGEGKKVMLIGWR